MTEMARRTSSCLGDVGVLCAYVPREIIAAAGFRPRLIRGLESREPDAFLAGNLCPYVRRCASFLTGDDIPALAALVLTDSCYPMLRLWDLLRERSSLPVWLLRVPRKHTPGAVAFFRRELEGLADWLNAIGGATLYEERLREIVDSYNESRQLREQVATRLMCRTTPGMAAKFTATLDAEHRLPIACFQERLSKLRDETDRACQATPRPRLLVAGSFLLNTELIKILEESGAVVAAVDSCTYGRSANPMSAVNGENLLDAMAAAYLAQAPCPRMDQGKEVAAHTAALARREHLDGAVYALPRHCTPHAYHLPIWREALREAGVPVLVLETDDAAWSRPAVLTRIEAFLESLAETSHA